MSREYLCDGAPVTVTIEPAGDRLRVRVGERDFAIESVTVDERQVRFVTADGRHHRFAIAQRAGNVFLCVHGDSIELAPSSTAGEDDAPGVVGFMPELVAPMPGKILDVLVSSGDVVEHDTALLRMEAMKMEQTIRAPFAARIRELRVEPGTMVGPGAVLMVLEPVEEPSSRTET